MSFGLEDLVVGAAGFGAGAVVTAYFAAGISIGVHMIRKERKKKKEGKNAYEIAVIPIEGTIARKPSKSTTAMAGSNYAMPQRIKRQIKNALKNRRTKGIIFDISSGGGNVQPSEDIANTILKIERETQESFDRRCKDKSLEKEYEPVPTVAMINDMGCSGAYLISCACNKIIACETSMIGSIGVFSMRLDISEAAKRYGVKMEVFKAGKHKAEGLPFKAVTPEEKERSTAMAEKVHEWFKRRVYEGRKSLLTMEEIEEIATGEAFMGDEALKYKLIDQIGGMDEAIKMIEEVGKFKHTDVKEYRIDGPKLPFNLPFMEMASNIGESAADTLSDRVENLLYDNKGMRI
ncbi:MAG: S49 family peptidase [Candidatus Woesearchaeota archaeon]